ncbi:MAG: ATP-binding protein [Candidatus Cloacimonetes bacterium]|nr:ATP-binding protein [Candidatus Cloacimonadota bacterium]
MVYVKRDLEIILKKRLDAPEILAILGSRQCGKTTLLKHISKNLKSVKFISFEDPDILHLFEEDVKVFAEFYLKNCKILIIDEFQYAKAGGQKLKYIYDTYPNKKLIISGSSALELTIQATKYLVGRIFIFYLYPFNFCEYLEYKDKELKNNFFLKIQREIKEKCYQLSDNLPNLPDALCKRLAILMDNFIVYGGYPRQVTTNDTNEKKIVLRNIYITYMLKEIREILNLSADYELSKLVKTLSLQIGNLVVLKELSNFTNLGYERLLKHLNILEKTFVVKLLNPYYSNKLQELVKSQKVYFYDSGFRNIIIDAMGEANLRTDTGALYENMVFSELVKNGVIPKFWRTKSKAEVDFILEKHNHLVPIEVKFNLNSITLNRSMINFIKKYKPTAAFVLSRDFYGIRKFENTVVYFLPLFLVNCVV